MIKSFLSLGHTRAGSMVGLPYFIQALVHAVKIGWAKIPSNFFSWAVPLFFVAVIMFLGVKWVTSLPECGTPEANNSSCASEY